MIWGMEDLAYFEEELDREPWLIEHYGMPRRSGRGLTDPARIPISMQVIFSVV